MDILGNIGNLLSSAFTGGLTGIIGSLSSAFINYKMKKLEFEHQKEMKKLEMEARRVDIEIVKAQVEGALQLAEQKTLEQSYQELNKEYFAKSYFNKLPKLIRSLIAFLFAILDFIRGIIRPFLTAYIVFLVSWIGYKSYQADPQSFITSVPILVKVILYLSVTVVTWWFSDRAIQKFLFREVIK